MSTYKQFAKDDDDSSENEGGGAWPFLGGDSAVDLGLGDKIVVKDGEL